MIIDKIIVSLKQPSRSDIAWAKPFPQGFALYLNYNGKWQPQILVNDQHTSNPDDDKPAEIGGQLGPDTVGTEQIIDNSVIMDDLNDSVKDKIRKTYVEENESLHMDYDIVDPT